MKKNAMQYLAIMREANIYGSRYIFNVFFILKIRKWDQIDVYGNCDASPMMQKLVLQTHQHWIQLHNATIRSLFG